MPPLSASDIAAALYGLTRLARLEPAGLDFFEATPAGLLKSYWGAIALLPLYLVTLVVVLATADASVSVDPLRYITVKTITYVIDWVAFPLAILSLAPMIGLDDRVFRFLVPLNWLQVPINLGLLVLILLFSVMAIPAAVATLINLVIVVALLAMTVALARYALDVPWWAAAGMGLLNITLGLFLLSVASAMILRP
ncbi:hypothetical protein F1188_11800 [Roseospira marina]|uniref:Uncharacterized protein n=1 Tax=Roseospira marina TaxID=140057 RepID=A0A5M6IBB4_9PROT|nr:hypothetical protein [Roseospira marina]KAA5605247.1 hypothetical protein F1188_11800 [Roseospira marina]MBB4314706.1 hypothetical protein [Roseospira marina]MBB5087695.1 hypothetical protein [Roseospira marina]